MSDDAFARLEEQRRRLDAEIEADMRKLDSMTRVVIYSMVPVLVSLAGLLLALAYRTISQ